MFLMRAGMIVVYLTDGLAGLVEVAVEAVAGATVIGVAQAQRGAAMMCRLAEAELEVGAEAGTGTEAEAEAGAGAGAGVTLGTVVPAAVGVIALVLDVGLKEGLALDLHVLTLAMWWSTKAHPKSSLQMIIGITLTRKMTITSTWRMRRWERLIWIARPVRRMTNLLRTALFIMAKAGAHLMVTLWWMPSLLKSL
jgi:hypothetical protein